MPVTASALGAVALMANQGPARLFRNALTRRLSVPISASTGRDYGGYRKLAQTFEYSENSNAGFVELSPDHVMTGQELFDARESTRAVNRQTKVKQRRTATWATTTWSTT